MLTRYINKRHVIERMHNSYFSCIFERYIIHLHQLGYKPTTIRMYCLAVEHFGQWLKKKKISIESINESNTKNFLEKHLLICNCSPPNTKDIKSISAAIKQLLKILYEENLLLPTSIQLDNAENIANVFDAYLADICGMAKNTRIYRRRYTLAFLRQAKISNLSQIEQISPKQITSFIWHFSQHYKSGSITVVSSSLRSFFKYLSFYGYEIKHLMASIPRLPNWKLSTIPSWLNNEQIKKVLSVFDTENAVGKRDYAIGRCFTDLGLRCCEVAKIKLNDINWHNGIIKISLGKADHEDQLPLPQITGEALADYLLHGRPKTNSEFIFVFHRAPLGETITVDTARGIIRRAFKKAGLNPAPGIHILRHSFATNLLTSGTSLKVISDMLRHKSIDTTILYTKVDLLHLRYVAMPWFGRKS